MSSLPEWYYQRTHVHNIPLRQGVFCVAVSHLIVWFGCSTLTVTLCNTPIHLSVTKQTKPQSGDALWNCSYPAVNKSYHSIQKKSWSSHWNCKYNSSEAIYKYTKGNCDDFWWVQFLLLTESLHDVFSTSNWFCLNTFLVMVSGK